MKIKILAINTYIESWQAVLEGELDGKTLFEVTQEEYGHFVQNSKFYKIKSKKLYFDEAYKKKEEFKKETENKMNRKLELKTQLCGHKELEEKFIKYDIGTTEIENKISDIQEKIRELEGSNAVQE